MSACTCKDCRRCIHLTSDSESLTGEKLLSQMVCVLCWVPLGGNSLEDKLDANPVVADCGHSLHLICLEQRRQLFRF